MYGWLLVCFHRVLYVELMETENARECAQTFLISPVFYQPQIYSLLSRRYGPIVRKLLAFNR